MKEENPFKNIFKCGTQAAYDALKDKEPGSIYFCEDTGKMYMIPPEETSNEESSPVS